MSDQDDDLFKNKEGEQDDPFKELLAEIKRDDGSQKYDTSAEAIKALKESQDHIKNLETELKALREAGSSNDKFDEILEALKNSKGGGAVDDGEKAAIKPDDVQTIVENLLNSRESTKTRSENIDTVVNVFKERYGKDAGEKLYSKANDLGFNKAEINRMIAENPKAALKILGEDTVRKGTNDVVLDTSTGVHSKKEEAPVSVMGGTNTKQLTDAWTASIKRTREKLGVE